MDREYNGEKYMSITKMDYFPLIPDFLGQSDTNGSKKNGQGCPI